MNHFAIEVKGEIRPLCGEWREVPNWTKVRSAVTCPRCAERLEAAGAELLAEPAANRPRRSP